MQYKQFVFEYASLESNLNSKYLTSLKEEAIYFGSVFFISKDGVWLYCCTTEW